MRICRTLDEVRAARAACDESIALVMTMGALHAGHEALVRAAHGDLGGERAGQVWASVFVNPLQFGPGEDYERYPRTFEADAELLERAGVQVVFAPSVAEMYPGGDPIVTVSSGSIGTVLEGAARPGHFDGVLTVVNKVFNLVRPRWALFGQKDAQQLMAVRRMVADLNMDVEIVPVPTVREPDGLARSSRNVYLSESDREHALALPRALYAAVAAAEGGAMAPAVRAAGADLLAGDPEVQVDYFELLDPATAQPVSDDHTGEAIAAVAARVGTTRLIDNLPLVLRPGEDDA